MMCIMCPSTYTCVEVIASLPSSPGLLASHAPAPPWPRLPPPPPRRRPPPRTPRPLRPWLGLHRGQPLARHSPPVPLRGWRALSSAGRKTHQQEAARGIETGGWRGRQAQQQPVQTRVLSECGANMEGCRQRRCTKQAAGPDAGRRPRCRQQAQMQAAGPDAGSRGCNRMM